LKFSLQQEFPAGVGGLWTAIGRPDYPQSKYLALGSTDVAIHRFTVTRDLIEVDLERKVPVVRAGLPAWARPFAASQQQLHHHTRWQRVNASRIDAHLEIAAVGLPVAATATGTVVETSTGRALLTLHFDVRCKLPVIGARMASLFAREVRQAMEADYAFTLDYLRGRRVAGKP
jgi:hypothetical protein